MLYILFLAGIRTNLMSTLFVLFRKAKITLNAVYLKLLCIQKTFHCYFFSTTLLPNVNTFSFARLMAFLVIYRERLLKIPTLNAENNGKSWPAL